MADDGSNTSFATPNELAAQREYAQKLLQGGSYIQPSSGGAVSPFQALGGILQAYAGNKQLQDAAAQERARNVAIGGANASITTDGSQPSGPLSMQPPGANSQGAGIVDKLLPAIAKNETGGSGNPYSQLGPAVVNRKNGTVDHAYGKYQVMGANIPQWTQEILNSPMTPQQFLASPDAQEKVARGKLSQYITQYGPEGAAKAWFAGPAGMNNPNAQDVNHMTVARYGANAMANMNGAQPAPNVKVASAGPGLPTGAMGPSPAPASTPAGTPAPAGGMMAIPPPPPSGGGAQVAQNTQVAAGPSGLSPAIPPSPAMGAPGVAPAGPGGTVAPGMFAQRPRISPEAYRAIMSNPDTSEASNAQKANATAVWQSQNQPVSFKTQYGTVVRAQNGQEQFIGDPVDMSIKGPNGDVPVHGFYNADGSIRIAQPQGQGGGGAAPGGPNVPPPPPAQQPPTSAPAPGPSGANQQAMPKFASLEGGTTSDAGMLGANPPPKAVASAPAGMPANPTAAPGGTPAAAGPSPGGVSPASPNAGAGGGAQYAQSMVPGYARDTLSDLGTIAAQQEMKKSAASEAGKGANEFVQTMRDKSLVAADESKKLDILNSIVHDPSYFSGFGSPLVQLERRMVAGWGGDPKAAANMELADKFMNDLNLDSLKTRLGGLGQIRVVEANMVQNAFLNRDNSVVANQALVTYAQAVNQRLQQAAEMTNKLLAANNWVPDPSIQAKVYDYFANKPMMDDATAKQWNKQITTDAEARKGAPKVAPEPPSGFVKKGAPAPASGPLAVPPPAKPAAPELPL